MTIPVSHTELTRPMLHGIKNPCLKILAIQGGKRMPARCKIFAPAVFITVKAGLEAELAKASE